jgi:hypothetical protein
MSGLAMWLRALPGRRWLPLGLALLAVLSLALGHLAGSARPSAGGASSPVAGVPDSGTLPIEQPTPTATPSPDVASVAAAVEVARGFTVAYGSYRSDDPVDALRQRLRPFDSDAFDASLGQGGGPGLDAQAAAARHQVATASVQQVSVTGLAPDGRLVVVVLVSQTLHSDAGDRASSRYLELFLVQTAAGWRVDEVMA